MDLIQERLANPIVAGPIAGFFAYIIITKLIAKPLVPSNLPWVGKDSSQLFSDSRAAFGSLKYYHQWLADGYAKYSKQGKSYVFPDFSGHPEIVIPRTSIKWLLEQPDNVLSTSEIHYDFLVGSYNFTDAHILKDPYHEYIIHRSLSRKIPPLIMDIWDELSSSFDDTWGFDTDNWKEITLMDNMMIMIARASNRLFVGMPLCRNEEYLHYMGKFAMDIITNKIILDFVPTVLYPLFGRLVTIRNHYHYLKTTKYTLPLIKERLANMERKRNDPTFHWTEPNDYLSWHINLASAENNTRELTPDMISRRLMPINFAAIHTTMMTITNTLLDLFGSEPSKGYMAGIQEEVFRVYAECDGHWDKASLGKLVRTDSMIRESMRVSNFMTRGLSRKVMPKDGITNKAEGWSAPQNAYISVDIHSVMHDPEIYPDPNTFDAFRFSRPREEYEKRHEGSSGGAKDDAELLRLKQTGLITTGDTFLPFSHGRHACPGRFFVQHELKMLIAYMFLNYEVEPLPSRPANQWLGQNLLPPMKQTIRVRRKKGTC